MFTFEPVNVPNIFSVYDRGEYIGLVSTLPDGTWSGTEPAQDITSPDPMSRIGQAWPTRDGAAAELQRFAADRKIRVAAERSIDP